MLTDRQKSIVYGSLLGDGSISPIRSKNGNCAFYKLQCAAFEEYVHWHLEELSPYGSSVKPKNSKLNGKDYPAFNFLTHTDPIFTELRRRWYIHKKVVPEDLILDPLMVAVWFVDDGTNNTKGTALFCTDCFEEKEVNLLVYQLEKLGIHSFARIEKGKWRIVIRGYSYLDFIDMIKPHVTWDCFQYKLNTTNYNPKHNILGRELATNVFTMYYDDKMPQYEIANYFNIDPSCISDILRGKSYRSLGLTKAIPGVSINPFPGKGVTYDKSRDKWSAYLGSRRLGRFVTKEAAELARQNAVNEKLKILP